MTQTVVGLIGAGRMGLPIIGHLARADFSVVVHDLDPAKRAAVETQGAQWAQSVAEWACLVANHEGLALAQRYGLDVEALRHALLTGTATNGALQNWGRQTMAWADDDLAIVTEMAHDCGIALPQAGVVRDICRTLKPRRYRIEEYGR